MASAAGEGPAALPPGTRIRIEGLFDKVPARRKFLRSPRAEYAACLDAVKRLAMARSDVGFTLDHDGRRILTLQPADAADARRRAAHPRARPPRRRHRLRARWTAADRRDQPADLQPRRWPTSNILFVNSRPVKDRLLVGALRAAYRDLIARDRHPIAALFLEVPLEEVDVNVHPAKTEVRFRDPAAVRGLIVGGLRHALDEESQRSAAREQAAAPVMWTTSASYAPRACDSRDLPRGSSRFRGEQRCVARRSASSSRTAGAPNRRSSPCRATRLASRAARLRRPTSSPRPRTAW